MATTYEAEIRIFIDNIDDFEEKLNSLDGVVKLEYEFTDTYYKPKEKEWDPNQKNLRFREWHNPIERGNLIYFSKTEFVEKSGIKIKKSLLKEGKLVLFKGDKETAKNLLNDLGFSKWFIIVKKNCKVWFVKKLDAYVMVEFFPELGEWLAELEIEGTNIDKAGENIKNIVDALGVKKYTFKPMSTIFLEATQK